MFIYFLEGRFLRDILCIFTKFYLKPVLYYFSSSGISYSDFIQLLTIKDKYNLKKIDKLKINYDSKEFKIYFLYLSMG